MSESHYRRRIIQMLKPLDAVAVENSVYPGTPDVNFTEGWLEIKWLPEWPKREGTVVAVPHFTTVQRMWLTKRRTAGGNAWLVLICEREWLLFDGLVAARYLGQLPRAPLATLACHHFRGRIDPTDFINVLLQKPTHGPYLSRTIASVPASPQMDARPTRPPLGNYVAEDS